MTQVARRFTVFARPAADGRTPEFVVMQSNVVCSRAGFTMTFTSHKEAQKEADQRERNTRESTAFERAQSDFEARRF